MRNPFQFHQSQNGRDSLLVTFWVAVALGISVAANLLAFDRIQSQASISISEVER